TRLTVIDKLPADDPSVFPAAPSVAPDAATLLAWVDQHVPARQPVALPTRATIISSAAAPRTVRGYVPRAARIAAPVPLAEPEGVELAYETVDAQPAGAPGITDAIYEAYGLQAIRIPGSQAHPTQLVQSAAMASVTPPRPSYRPRLPQNILDLLSDAQLETVIYAGEAHSEFLAGAWTVDDTFDVVGAAPEDA
ncbi:strawberry notch-like NTP hydrolase domain-containing protein, partial [Mesorhizobium humile]